MNLKFRCTAILLAAAVLLPAAAARAQWYSTVDKNPPPLYPYAKPAQGAYAVEVAPNTYVIHRPGETRHRPRHHVRASEQAAAPVVKKHRSKTDPALVEELRKRVAKIDKHDKLKNAAAVSPTHVVREKPIVHETTRYVDDPPRVVERRHYVEDRPVRSSRKRIDAAQASAGARVINRDGRRDEVRTFSAEAEITILGRDRMNIRLFRKGSQPNANAEAQPGDD
jgi:hypothetical protein